MYGYHGDVDDGERFDPDREYDPGDDKHIQEAEKCSVTLDCLLPPTTVSF